MQRQSSEQQNVKYDESKLKLEREKNKKDIFKKNILDIFLFKIMY